MPGKKDSDFQARFHRLRSRRGAIMRPRSSLGHPGQFERRTGPPRGRADAPDRIAPGACAPRIPAWRPVGDDAAKSRHRLGTRQEEPPTCREERPCQKLGEFPKSNGRRIPWPAPGFSGPVSATPAQTGRLPGAEPDYAIIAHPTGPDLIFGRNVGRATAMESTRAAPKPSAANRRKLP